MRPKAASAITLLSVGAALAGSGHNLPLDRPYTLRNPDPFPLERELVRQAVTETPMSFIFPRPCLSLVDSSRVCGESHGFGYRDHVRNRVLNLSPLAGYEYRYLGENIHVAELGVLSTGNSGPLSFYLDARMFTEKHEIAGHSSYDREFVERQDAGISGTVDYSSFSRYRANLSYDLPWGRFSAGRDAAHWGPGQHNNLVFNQEAIPFNQLTFTSRLGPVIAHILYGQLVTKSGRERDTVRQQRSLYAHRYEWNATRNLIFGISEQLIVYGYSEPFALLPVVPLFVYKGDAFERLNNGNIAFDAGYRLPGIGMIYSEFLIDDIQSPSNLFDDHWGNKWAWMAGVRWARIGAGWELGASLEYARLEPWVYTHYAPATAQAANMGYPLGSPEGPNSQRMTWSGYLRTPQGWTARFLADLGWKGDDLGSHIEDSRPTDIETKAFLEGVGQPDFSLQAAFGRAGRRHAFLVGGSAGRALEAFVSLRAFY